MARETLDHSRPVPDYEQPCPSRWKRVAAVAMITAGAVVLADVGITLAWKEPLSALYAIVLQANADDDVAELESEFPSASGSGQAQLRREAHRLANRFEAEVEQGQGIGSIRIPAIDADYALIEGVDLDELESGPGRYSSAALPGQGETVAVAGHRTTFLAPFRDIDDLEPSDEVTIEMPYASFTYSVDHSRVVEPDQLEVVRPVGRERLVLTACHPLHSAAERYVVFAELEYVSERA
jgi:sortase A